MVQETQVMEATTQVHQVRIREEVVQADRTIGIDLLETERIPDLLLQRTSRQGGPRIISLYQIELVLLTLEVPLILVALLSLVALQTIQQPLISGE